MVRAIETGMSRRVPLGGLLLAVVLALLPSASIGDTVDAAPVRSLTTAYAVNGVAVQPGSGNLFVSDVNGFIHVYAPTAGGSDPALYTLATGCTPWQLTFNATGTALLVPCGTVVHEVDPTNGAPLHSWTGPTQARAAVYTASSGILVADLVGNKIWRMDASASGPGAVALDGLNPNTHLANPAGLHYTADGTVYVANYGNETVTEYDQPPGLSALDPTPRRTIGLPPDVDETQSVVVDGRGNLYVGAFTGGVLVYPAGANGAPGPARRLFGPASGSGSTQVALLADRSLVVGQYGGPRVATFAALVPLDPPGAVSALAVAGKKTARKRTVTWAAGQAVDAPVTSYRLTITRGAKTVLSATTTAPSYVLKAKKLKKSGKYTVSVVAVSTTGTSPAAAATFKVKVRKAHRPHRHHG